MTSQAELDRFSYVPWTAVSDAPSFLHGGLPTPPCGFERQTYPLTGTVTHYRFVPICPVTRFNAAREE